MSSKTDYGHPDPPYLLHTKVLLFWSKRGTAILWVGSHNWTRRAIEGLNVEASFVIRLRDSSPLFCDAADYLAKVKTFSEEFDLAKVDYYKKAQLRSESRSQVIDLEVADAAALQGITIELFGTDVDDLQPRRTPRSRN